MLTVSSWFISCWLSPNLWSPGPRIFLHFCPLSSLDWTLFQRPHPLHIGPTCTHLTAWSLPLDSWWLAPSCAPASPWSLWASSPSISFTPPSLCDCELSLSSALRVPKLLVATYPCFVTPHLDDCPQPLLFLCHGHICSTCRVHAGLATRNDIFRVDLSYNAWGSFRAGTFWVGYVS